MATKNELDYVRPTVRISGSDVSDMDCIRITKRVGITPSSCDLRYRAGTSNTSSSSSGGVAQQDVTGPATLVNGGSYKHKQRVIVYERAYDRIWFHGWLSKRLDQHKANNVIWTALDDTILMRNIFVRGCYVQDTLLAGGLDLKYINAMPTTFNPKGAWNCTGKSIDGKVYPVFTPTAVFGKAYESPDTDYSGDPPTDGSHSPWTPRRVLKYLQLVMHSYELLGGLGGDDTSAFGCINSDYLYCDYAHIAGLDGIDPGIDEVDPLDRGMQELCVQGDTLIGAFIKALNIAGTHQLATLYDTTSIDAGKTLLRFKPSGYVSVDNWQNIGVQFNGAVDSSLGTIYDFSMLEDSTAVVRAAFCEGETELLETSLRYDRSDDSVSTITPAWTPQEQFAFLSCVFGSTDWTGSPGKYALVPIISGCTTYAAANFQDADGTNGTPIVKSMTDEAMALAQQYYPTVFRAFAVKNNNVLQEALGTYSLEHPRPILPTQLQFLTWQAALLGDARLRFSLPVRLRLKVTDDDPVYYDVPHDTAVRITTDNQGINLIWLDGCGIGADGTVECIYYPSILENYKHITSGWIKVRKFYLNCAMRKDTRVRGYKTSGILPNVSTDYDDAFEGGSTMPFTYIDRPTSFRHHRQHISYPAANLKYYGGTDGTQEISMPLTRDLPPGDESDHAEYAAARELSRVRRPVRDSSWMQAGIQRQLDAGDWLGYVYCYKNGTAIDYLVDGCVNSIVWDFLNQTTKVGDVFGEGSEAAI